MIGDILKLLSAGEYYGGGKFIEIAKGKHELVGLKGTLRKIKRIIRER